jgi:hypothetical protein
VDADDAHRALGDELRFHLVHRCATFSAAAQCAASRQM